MAYTLIKAIEDLEGRLGPDMTKWQLKNLQFVYYEHSPFSKSPLRLLFEEKRPLAVTFTLFSNIG